MLLLLLAPALAPPLALELAGVAEPDAANGL